MSRLSITPCSLALPMRPEWRVGDLVMATCIDGNGEPMFYEDGETLIRFQVRVTLIRPGEMVVVVEDPLESAYNNGVEFTIARRN
jgi:hypothetical protein